MLTKGLCCQFLSIIQNIIFQSFAWAIQTGTNVATNSTQTFTAHMSAMADLLHSEERLLQEQQLLHGRIKVYYRRALNQRHTPLPAQSTGVRTALHFPS